MADEDTRSLAEHHIDVYTNTTYQNAVDKDIERVKNAISKYVRSVEDGPEIYRKVLQAAENSDTLQKHLDSEDRMKKGISMLVDVRESTEKMRLMFFEELSLIPSNPIR